MVSRGSQITALFFLAVLFLGIFSPVISAADNKQITDPKVSVNDGPGYLSDEISKMGNTQGVKAPGIFSTLFNLFLSLLIVIALIYAVMSAVKYFYIKASIPMKSEGVIKVLAKEYLDSKKIVYAIEFGDRIILAGGGQDTLSLLAEIREPETVAKIKESADEYISKYRMREETKFSEEMKTAYLKQGKQTLEGGNKIVKKFMDRLKGGQKK